MPQGEPIYSHDITEDRGSKRFRVLARNRTPSWKRAGTGYAELTVSVHDKAEWIEFSLTEDSGSSQKQTHLAVPEYQAKALYRFLNAKFGEKNGQG